MATSDVTTLTPDVTLDLQRCPATLVSRDTRRAVRDFLMDSEVWREEAEITGVTGTVEYAIPLGTYVNTRVHRILHVMVDNVYLNSQKYRLTADGKILFETSAGLETGDVITAYVVFVPEIDSVLFLDEFMETYAEPIIARARERLRLKPGVPWFDSAMAEKDHETYMKGLDEARVFLGGKGANIV